jgi:hypothetical protein
VAVRNQDDITLMDASAIIAQAPEKTQRARHPLKCNARVPDGLLEAAAIYLLEKVAAHWRFGKAFTIFLSMPMLFDRSDYSVVVKRRAPPPNQWRWEIYRAGTASPIEHAPAFSHTMAAASRAGKEALKQLLDKLHSKHLRWPAA